MLAAQIKEKIEAKTEAKATPPIPINFKNIIHFLMLVMKNFLIVI